MPRRPIDLVSHWQLAAPADRVWAALADPGGWPAWWPAVSVVQTLHDWQAPRTGARWHLAWTAGGPFRGTLALQALEALPPARWRLRSQARPEVGAARAADQSTPHWLDGECIWLLRAEAGQTLVTQVWRLQPPSGPGAWLWPLAAPLLRWLHGRAMRGAAAGLARHLA